MSARSTGSSKSRSSTVSGASSTKPLIKVPAKTPATSTIAKRAPKSLRDRVVAREAARKTASPPPEQKDVIPMDTLGEVDRSLQELDIQRPIRVTSDTDDYDSDLEFGSEVGGSSRRDSVMFLTPGKKTTVLMDEATRAANDYLLRGKDALESAGNMKRECKVVAHECLTALYESVLGLSDSRARHKHNLERARCHHARELVNVERAHAKEMTEVRKKVIEDLSLARVDIAGSLEETRAVRSWLGYETIEPFRGIKEIEHALKALEESVREERGRFGEDHPDGSPKWEVVHAELSRLGMHVINVSNQLDELRRQLNELPERLVNPLQAAPSPPSPRSQHSGKGWLEEDIGEMKLMLREISASASAPVFLPEPSPPVPNPMPDLAEHFRPLEERLEIIASELRVLRDVRCQAQQPHAPSINAELTMTEVKQSLEEISRGMVELSKAERPQSYAQAVAKKSQPTNHTLIVSSSDPKLTSENVIDRIKVALDLKETGAKVDRVRKAKNQKVILSCASNEDLELVKGRVRLGEGLSVQEPKKNNPLVCVRGVLSCYTNEEIVDHMRAQNKQLLRGTDVTETMKVRYRKRARNPHICHPVLEVSPKIWNRLTQAGMVHVGIQRSPLEDQSPLMQCTRCLAYGHTKTVCREKFDLCCHCGGSHTWRDCPGRAEGRPAVCTNCVKACREDQAHGAFSEECRERQKWDGIARSRISYC